MSTNFPKQKFILRLISPKKNLFLGDEENFILPIFLKNHNKHRCKIKKKKKKNIKLNLFFFFK